MRYTGRNGCEEQVRFIRQQPPGMRHAPWDFDLRSEDRKRLALEITMVVLAVVAVLLFWLTV